MTKPPKTRASQKDYVQSAVRFPPELRAELQDAARRHDHSFNAEVLARIRASDVSTITAELAEVKAMLRKVLDQM